MRRIASLILAFILLFTIIQLPAMAATANPLENAKLVDYRVPASEYPAFSEVFGKENSLAVAQTLLQNFTVDTANGPALTPSARPRTVMESLSFQEGPMLYPVYTNETHNAIAGERAFYFLNENMEKVTDIIRGNSLQHCYAKGPDGDFYLGCWVIIGDGSEESIQRILYTPDGKPTRAYNEHVNLFYGDVEFWGTLCIVGQHQIAKWNPDTHTVGDLLSESNDAAFFDEAGNVYGSGYQDYESVYFSYDQAGNITYLPVQFASNRLFGRDYLRVDYFKKEYLSTLTGTEGLYPNKNEAGLYGYLDDQGNWAITPQFYDALPFTGQYAVVTLDDSYVQTIIDRSGTQIEGVKGQITFVPGYGYLVSYEGYGIGSCELLNLNGIPWLRTELQLYYSDSAPSIIGIGNHPTAEIDWETGTISVGNEVEQYGNLLVKQGTIGTVDGTIVAHTRGSASYSGIERNSSLRVYSKSFTGRDNREYSYDFYDVYNTEGQKIVSDAYNIQKVGNYYWVEKESERGYVAMDGTWSYHESWDTGMLYYDVTREDWYFEPVQYVLEKGLLPELSLSEFGPNVMISRGDLVTMLYFLSGQPEIEEPVEALYDDYFRGYMTWDAVIWANQNNIASGYGERRFGPDDNVSREDAVSILYRFAQYCGQIDTDHSNDLSAFSDEDQISDYAKVPMEWAVANTLISGKPGQVIDPHGNITRAEMSAILYRFSNQ